VSAFPGNNPYPHSRGQGVGAHPPHSWPTPTAISSGLAQDHQPLDHQMRPTISVTKFSPRGPIGNKTTSLHRLSQQPLHPSHNIQGTRACCQAASGPESEPEPVLPLDQKATNQYIYTHRMHTATHTHNNHTCTCHHTIPRKPRLGRTRTPNSSDKHRWCMSDMEGLYETPHDGSLWRTRWLGTILGRFFEHERYSERFSTVAPYDFLKLYVVYAC
jgi:hypothetical protein